MANAAHNDLLRVLHRLVTHLSACAPGVVEVPEHGKLVQIEINQAQVDVLVRVPCRMECRPRGQPASWKELRSVTSIENQKIDGKKVPVSTSFRLSLGDRLFISNTQDDKGRFFGCYVNAPAGSGVPEFRYAFSKQVLSNFCELDGARPLMIGNSGQRLTFPCVEAVFQFVKVILTGDAAVLESSLLAATPQDIKKIAGALTIDDAWFNASPDRDSPVSQTTMFFLQAWAATSPSRWELLKYLMNNAIESVPPVKVFFYEHVDFDKIYGTGYNPDDYAAVFSDAINTNGLNIMGKALKQTALQVHQSDSYSNYMDWFIRTFETPGTCLFVLK